MSMLKTSYMRGARKSMCKLICVQSNTRLANEDLTPRWLNRISGAYVLIPIESTHRGG